MWAKWLFDAGELEKGDKCSVINEICNMNLNGVDL